MKEESLHPFSKNVCFTGDNRNIWLRDDPKDKVKSIAMRDGDRLKAEAVTALTRKRSVEMARHLLAQASLSYEWAGQSPITSGIKAIEKDSAAFETRYNADINMETAVELAVAGKIAEAEARTEAALQLYRKAKSVQQISDAQIMSTCLRAELDLQYVPPAFGSREIRKAAELVGDAHQIFSAASMLTATAVLKWVQQVNVKLLSLSKVLTFCKTWICADDMIASGLHTADDGSDIHTLLGRLNALVTELTALQTSFVVVPSNLLQDVLNAYDGETIAAHQSRVSHAHRASLIAPPTDHTIEAHTPILEVIKESSNGEPAVGVIDQTSETESPAVIEAAKKVSVAPISEDRRDNDMAKDAIVSHDHPQQESNASLEASATCPEDYELDESLDDSLGTAENNKDQARSPEAVNSHSVPQNVPANDLSDDQSSEERQNSNLEAASTESLANNTEWKQERAPFSGGKAPLHVSDVPTDDDSDDYLPDEDQDHNLEVAADAEVINEEKKAREDALMAVDNDAPVNGQVDYQLSDEAQDYNVEAADEVPANSDVSAQVENFAGGDEGSAYDDIDYQLPDETTKENDDLGPSSNEHNEFYDTGSSYEIEKSPSSDYEYSEEQEGIAPAEAYQDDLLNVSSKQTGQESDTHVKAAAGQHEEELYEFDDGSDS